MKKNLVYAVGAFVVGAIVYLIAQYAFTLGYDPSSLFSIQESTFTGAVNPDPGFLVRIEGYGLFSGGCKAAKEFYGAAVDAVCTIITP